MKRMLILTACLLSFAGTYPKNLNILNKSEATNYINHVIDNLFDLPNNFNQDINLFKQDTKNLLINKLGFYCDSIKQINYNREDLHEEIINQVINYIENKARKYTQSQLNNMNLSDKINQKKIKHKVINNLRNKLYACLSDKTAQVGIASSFVGTNLKERINKLIEIEIKENKNLRTDFDFNKDIKPKYKNKPKIKKNICYPEYYVDYYAPVVEYIDVPVYQPVVYQPVCQPVRPRPGFCFGAGVSDFNGFLDFQFCI